MARSTDSFIRGGSRFKPQPTTLVLCEDSKSGLNYIKDASKHFRVEVKVKVSHCGKTDPKGIVQEALHSKAKYDKVYCMIDRDTHHNFDEAIALAEGVNEVVIVDSHPCFEFWLLLHFKKTRKPYKASGANSAADNLIKDLRKQPGMGGYSKSGDKGIFNSLLGEKFQLARTNSPQILQEALAEENLNPSTKLHMLIQDMEDLAAPQLIE